MNALTRSLCSAREKLRLDVVAFASLLEVDVVDVQAWETGIQEARASVLVRCARALTLTVDELLDGELAENHSDLPPERAGIREGVLLDETAAALSEGRIDRVEAHRVLGLALSDRLPEHPKLSEAQRAPLRTVDDDVRSIVRIGLTRSGSPALCPGDVRRVETGWHVSICDASGQPVAEQLVSFDLDAERAQLSDDSDRTGRPRRWQGVASGDPDQSQGRVSIRHGPKAGP